MNKTFHSMFHPKVTPVPSWQAKASRFYGSQPFPANTSTTPNIRQQQNSNNKVDRTLNAANHQSCCDCAVCGKILLGLLILVLLGGAVVTPIFITQALSSHSSSVNPIETTLNTTVTTVSSTTSTTDTTTSTSSTTETTSSSTSTSTSQTTSTTATATTSTSTTTTSAILPAQCSGYVLNTDGTRNVAYTATVVCDSFSGQWVRFSGAAGTQIPTSVVATYSCGTHAPGYYTGPMPVTGATTTGSVCYNWSGNNCNWSNSISVTNCNGFYVYYLIVTPACSLRYCTI